MQSLLQKDPKELIKLCLRWAIGIFLFVTAIYVLVLLFTTMRSNVNTETAVYYTMADSVYLDGVAVFSGEDVPGSGTLGYLVEDGERVTAGTVLAERYTNDSQPLLREQLTTLEQQINLLDKSQNSVGSSLTLLTRQTSDALYELLDRLDTGAYSSVTTAEQEFLLAQNRLQISTGQAQNFSDTIADLQAEYDSLYSQLANLETIRASTNGYFIAGSKAAVLQTSPETLEAAAPAELKALLTQGIEAPSNPSAGRIVTGFSWKFYAICPIEQADRFKPGAGVQFSVPGRMDDPVSAKVLSVDSNEASGISKVVLECQSVNAQVLTLGQVRAKIDLHTYSGLRINVNARHIVKGVPGVYVANGNVMAFRKIEVLYEGEDYMIVPAKGSSETDSEVRLYDEVIVEGKNLSDGGKL